MSLTSIFWASSEALKLDLMTTLTSSLVRPTSLTRGMTLKGRMMSLVVRYLGTQPAAHVKPHIDQSAHSQSGSTNHHTVLLHINRPKNVLSSYVMSKQTCPHLYIYFSNLPVSNFEGITQSIACLTATLEKRFLRIKYLAATTTEVPRAGRLIEF